MSIFTLDQRLCRLAFQVFLTLVIWEIHRAGNVSTFSTQGPFILYRTRLIHLLDHIISLSEILTITCLISHTPHNDRRMVEVSPYHSLHSLKMSILKIRIMCKRSFLISHSVRFDVRLIHDIDAVSVTQSIPQRIIRIVTSSDSIDIELLHYPDITDHIFLCNHIALVRIHLMPVGTLYKDRLAIHKKKTILDAYVTEADID